MTKPPIAPATFPAKRGGNKVDAPVTVEVIGDEVRVEWVTSCARRTFTREGLRDVLAHIETCMTLGDDVWLESSDRNGSYFAALVKDGRVYGADSIRDPESIDNVSWAKLKAALTARTRMRGPEHE
jgi:hypothetical protein